jgi:Flp pilus assembly protein TadD
VRGDDDTLRQEAERLLRQALTLSERTPEAIMLLAVAVIDASLPEFAETILRDLLRDHPTHSAAHHLLGCALRDQCRYESAAESLRQAIALDPHRPAFHMDLADTLRRQGALDESRLYAQQALTLSPENAHAHFTLGNTLHQLGHFVESHEAYERALAIDPNHAAAHRNRAVSHFLHGNFPAGYTDYEWRWKLKGFRGTLERLQKPAWNGEPLAGRTLLLHAEQGLGDTVQFIRYVPLIAKEQGRVIVQVQPPLVRLLERLQGIDAVVARGDALPPFDLHCPLLSLPRIFQTTLETIPHRIPYLHIPESTHAPSDSSTLHVGVAWAGNPRHTGDRLRSIPLTEFRSLFDLPGIRFYRLHTTDSHAPESSAHPHLLDPTAAFTDLATTAGFMHTLDLVISVDTVIAHLAGAMGKPVWTLLPFIPDWRWLLDRDDSPWYPTMRLFRQTTRGDWSTVLLNVRQRLKDEQSRG